MQIKISEVSQDIRQINSSIVIVQPEFHLWSGRRALKPQKLKELNPMGINLPPAGLASLGAVKLVDPEEIKPFDKIKDDVHRKLAVSGLHLFGGYAIHEDDFQSNYQWLKDQVVSFEDLKASMLRVANTTAQETRMKQLCFMPSWQDNPLAKNCGCSCSP